MRLVSAALWFACCCVPSSVLAAGIEASVDAGVTASPASTRVALVEDRAYVVGEAMPRVDRAAKVDALSNPGALSGGWFDPQQSGHGFAFIFGADGTVAATWYVYHNGNQVWLVGSGRYDGATNRVTMTMVRPTGGQFPPNFSPSQVRNNSWGTLQLTVTSCDTINASWSPTDGGFPPGAMILVPIIRNGGNCGLGGGNPPPPPPPPPASNITVNFRNDLIRSVQFDYTGGSVVVPAGGTASRTFPASSSLAVVWTLDAANQSGVRTGDLLGGSFVTINNPSGTYNVAVDFEIAGDLFFAPVITNNSGTRLLIGTNMGLQAENRCNCVAQATGEPIFMGYYRLFTNSNVRGYRDGSGYTGSYIYWGQGGTGGAGNSFFANVQAPSGRLNLTANNAPP